jgi:hypothetical protein
MRIKYVVAAVMGLIGCMLSFAPAHADVTYTYTGNDFTEVTGAYAKTDSITATITLTSALADNISSLIDIPAADIVSFSLSDGQQTITNTNDYSSGFAFETNSLGDITSWNISAIGSNTYDEIESSDVSGDSEDAGQISNGSKFTYGLNVNHPGSWAVSATPVPEPGSLVLLATGLVAVMAVGAMRRRQARLSSAT